MMEDIQGTIKNLAGNLAGQSPASLRAMADTLMKTAGKDPVIARAIKRLKGGESWNDVQKTFPNNLKELEADHGVRDAAIANAKETLQSRPSLRSFMEQVLPTDWYEALMEDPEVESLYNNPVQDAAPAVAPVADPPAAAAPPVTQKEPVEEAPAVPTASVKEVTSKKPKKSATPAAARKSEELEASIKHGLYGTKGAADGLMPAVQGVMAVLGAINKDKRSAPAKDESQQLVAFYDTISKVTKKKSIPPSKYPVPLDTVSEILEIPEQYLTKGGKGLLPSVMAKMLSDLRVTAKSRLTTYKKSIGSGRYESWASLAATNMGRTLKVMKLIEEAAQHGTDVSDELSSAFESIDSSIPLDTGGQEHLQKMKAQATRTVADMVQIRGVQKMLAGYASSNEGAAKAIVAAVDAIASDPDADDEEKIVNSVKESVLNGTVSTKDAEGLEVLRLSLLKRSLSVEPIEGVLRGIDRWFQSVAKGEETADTLRKARVPLEATAKKVISSYHDLIEGKKQPVGTTDSGSPEGLPQEEIVTQKSPELDKDVKDTMEMRSFQLAYTDYLEAMERLRLLDEYPEHKNAAAWNDYVDNYEMHTLPSNIKDLLSYANAPSAPTPGGTPDNELIATPVHKWKGEKVKGAPEAQAAPSTLPAELLKGLPLDYHDWLEKEKNITAKVTAQFDDMAGGRTAPELVSMRASLSNPRSIMYTQDADSSLPVGTEYGLFNRACHSVFKIVDVVLSKEEAGHHKIELEKNTEARTGYNEVLRKVVSVVTHNASPLSKYLSHAASTNMVHSQQLARGLNLMQREGLRSGSNRISYTYFLEGLLMVLSGLHHIGGSDYSGVAKDADLVEQLGGDLADVTKVYENFMTSTSSFLEEEKRLDTSKAEPPEVGEHLEKHRFLENAKRGQLRDLEVSRTAAEQMSESGMDSTGMPLSNDDLAHVRDTINDNKVKTNKILSGGVDYGSILHNALDAHEAAAPSRDATSKALTGLDMEKALGKLDQAGAKSILEAIESGGDNTAIAADKLASEEGHPKLESALGEVLKRKPGVSEEDAKRAVTAVKTLAKKDPSAVSGYLDAVGNGQSEVGAKALDAAVDSVRTSIERQKKQYGSLQGVALGAGGSGGDTEKAVTTEKGISALDLFTDPVKYGRALLLGLKEKGGGKIRVTDARKMFADLLEKTKTYMTDTTVVGDTKKTRQQLAAEKDQMLLNHKLADLHKKMRLLNTVLDHVVRGYNYATDKFLELVERLEKPEEQYKGPLSVPGGRYRPSDPTKGLTKEDIAQARANKLNPIETKAGLDAVLPEKRRRKLYSAVNNVLGLGRWNQMHSDVRRGIDRRFREEHEDATALERRLFLKREKKGKGSHTPASAESVTAVVPGYKGLTDKDLLHMVIDVALSEGASDLKSYTNTTPVVGDGRTRPEQGSPAAREDVVATKWYGDEKATRVGRAHQKVQNIFFPDSGTGEDTEMRTAATTVSDPGAAPAVAKPAGGPIAARLRQLLVDTSFIEQVRDGIETRQGGSAPAGEDLATRKIKVTEQFVHDIVDHLAKSEKELETVKSEDLWKKRKKKDLPHSQANFLYDPGSTTAEDAFDSPEQLRVIASMLKNELATHHSVWVGDKHQKAGNAIARAKGDKESLTQRILNFPSERAAVRQRELRDYIKKLYGDSAVLPSANGTAVKMDDLLALVTKDYTAALEQVRSLPDGAPYAATVDKKISEDAGRLGKLQESLMYANRRHSQAQEDHSSLERELLASLPATDRLRADIQAIEDHLAALESDDVSHRLWEGGPKVLARNLKEESIRLVDASSADENRVNLEISKLQKQIDDTEKAYRSTRSIANGEVDPRGVAVLARNFMRSIFETLLHQVDSSAGHYYTAHDLDALDSQDIKKVVREELGLINDTKLISILFYLKQMRTQLSEFLKRYPHSSYWVGVDITGGKVLQFDPDGKGVDPRKVASKAVSKLRDKINDREIEIWSKLNTLGRLQTVLEVDAAAREDSAILGDLLKPADIAKINGTKKHRQQIVAEVEKDADKGVEIMENDWISFTNMQEALLEGLKKIPGFGSGLKTKPQTI